jgi:hypothetical protein
MRPKRHRLVLIDETGTTTKMTCLRGRSMKGSRLNGKASFGHCGTRTFVAGFKCDGLIAPWDAQMNRAIFEAYETQLAPALRPGAPHASLLPNPPNQAYSSSKLYKLTDESSVACVNGLLLAVVGCGHVSGPSTR